MAAQNPSEVGNERYSFVLGDLSDVPLEGLDTGGCGAFLAGHRLAELDRDTRWRSRYLVMMDLKQPVAVLPIYEPLVGKIDPAYSQALDRVGVRAEKTVLLGGRSDFSATLLRRKGYEPTNEGLELLGTALTAAIAGRTADGLIALYVTDRNKPLFRAILGKSCTEAPLAEESRLRVRPDRRSYLSSLKSTHRSVVRRDWRAIETAKLELETCDWTDVPNEGADLVAAVRGKHGRKDHPRLVSLRLQGWDSNPEVETVAFVTRYRGELIAVCYGWIWNDLMQLYEIGLAEETEHRHLAYLSTMIYQPLEFAARMGLREIWLGLGSIEPKRLRGATVATVWGLRAPLDAERFG